MQDEVAINRMKRGDRDATLMQSTFPRRRRDILGHRRGEKAMSVKRIMKTYPALLETDEVFLLNPCGAGPRSGREALEGDVRS